MSLDLFTTELSHLAIIAVVGDKAETFLQGQLTCNMQEVTEQQTRLAAHCNSKGRALASFRVFKSNTGFYLQAPKTMLPLIIPELNKYAVFSRVKLTDVSDEIKSIGYGGEKAAEIIMQLINIELLVDQTVLFENCIITCIPSIVPRYVIVGELAAINKLQQKLNEAASKENETIWQLLDIQSEIAVIEPATSGLFTPHMLNYPALNAVSFKKGCYIGQEIIARTHYLGKSKRQLQVLKISASKTQTAGEKILDDNHQEIGIIVNSIKTAQDNYYVLAVMQTQT